jgi:uncharacterized membrane protein
VGRAFGFLLGAAAYAACIYIAFQFGDAVWSNVLICIFGGAFGWLVGILGSPRTTSEKREFSTYLNAVLTFITGFVVAKVDRLFEGPQQPDVMELVTNRLLLFAATFCLGALVTFVWRRRDVAPDPRS